ncbi:uncharacterized protein RAG0_16570 [Rhynchosporium agropyri]|uniref:Uncharacterized protein n=1 Tax=Rhynchosporium agropyri TaxID=914238 RepID=A0A1E1LQZ3_9HELO|nr:uncharacterized protein RAG0_16570 [Rhynchosporium agropyri]
MAHHQLSARFQACSLLLEAGIPCVVWCEDAVAHYGVPTVVFDLYVLVPDIEEAAKALIQEGWSLGDCTQSKFGNARLVSAHRSLIPPIDSNPTAKPDLSTPITGLPPLPSKRRPAPVKTILLPAAEWKFTLPRYEGSPTSVFPPLPKLLDGLVDKLLDDPLTDSMFWIHLVVLIGYLYDYVPVLREIAFAEKLTFDHRQFHFDWLSGMTIGLPFTRHERLIRDALRKGTYQLRECSADRDDETLFAGNIEVRIMAAKPFPYTPENYENEKRAIRAAEIADANADVF